jgi:hypothetical protein
VTRSQTAVPVAHASVLLSLVDEAFAAMGRRLVQVWLTAIALPTVLVVMSAL